MNTEIHISRRAIIYASLAFACSCAVIVFSILLKGKGVIEGGETWGVLFAASFGTIFSILSTFLVYYTLREQIRATASADLHHAEDVFAKLEQERVALIEKYHNPLTDSFEDDGFNELSISLRFSEIDNKSLERFTKLINYIRNTPGLLKLGENIFATLKKADQINVMKNAVSDDFMDLLLKDIEGEIQMKLGAYFRLNSKFTPLTNKWPVKVTEYIGSVCKEYDRNFRALNTNHVCFVSITTNVTEQIKETWGTYMLEMENNNPHGEITINAIEFVADTGVIAKLNLRTIIVSSKGKNQIALSHLDVENKVLSVLKKLADEKTSLELTLNVPIYFANKKYTHKSKVEFRRNKDAYEMLVNNDASEGQN